MFFRPSHNLNPEAGVPAEPPHASPLSSVMPKKKRQRWLMYVGIICGILLVLGLISPPSKPVGRSTAARTNTVIKDHHFGCVSRPYFDKLVRYIAQDDLQALNAAFVPAVLSGQCTKFKKGERIHLMEGSGLFGGTIKVRRPGEAVEYFTFVKAIRKGLSQPK
jgi:hypothetical protein